MVNPNTFKQDIKKYLIETQHIEFLGEDFETITLQISENQAEKIYAWIKKVVNKQIQPIFLGSSKPYKVWKMHELLIFRYPFTIKNTEYRILLIKVKNAVYIEFHLGDHTYYDKTRKELHIKQ